MGSIWKFPHEVGSNGGGAFVLFYVLGLALVVIPLMFAELALGRRGRADAATSIATVAGAHGASKSWAWVGVLGVITGMLVLSFYSVVGGWTIAYVIETAFDGLAGTDPAAVQARFDGLLAAPLRMTAYHALFMGVIVMIVARGIGGGIEASAKVLMPLLGVLMTGLACYSALEGDLAAALRFLFKLDLHSLSARAALEALGLGFFSIGVGFALMITYAAYARADVNLKQVAIVSVGVDTAISLLAGIAVFPLVFAHGLDPAGGPGLVLVTLPLAFGNMPFGTPAACAFFILLLVAALASAVSLLELAVAITVHRLGWQRTSASLVGGSICFCAGLATVLSFNLWSHWFPLAGLPGFERATVYDLIDHLTSNMLLPIGGLGLAIFCGWVLPARVLIEELQLSPLAGAWLRALLRYVVPSVIAAATLAPLML